MDFKSVDYREDPTAIYVKHLSLSLSLLVVRTVTLSSSRLFLSPAPQKVKSLADLELGFLDFRS